MIPARYEHYLFSLVLSGMMSLIVSGVSTLRAIGLVQGFLPIWLSS